MLLLVSFHTLKKVDDSGNDVLRYFTDAEDQVLDKYHTNDEADDTPYA